MTPAEASEAVRLARFVAEDQPTSAEALDTLAVALAAAGGFDEAAAVTRRAIRLASAGENTDLPRALHDRLARYQSSHAYNEDPAQAVWVPSGLPRTSLSSRCLPGRGGPLRTGRPPFPSGPSPPRGRQDVERSR